MEFKEEVKTVIEALSSGIRSEDKANNQEVIERLKVMHDEDPNHFLDVFEIATFEFESILNEVFGVSSESRNEFIVPFIANGIYEHFHETRIEKLEGFSCSADKSGFIRDMTLNAIKTGENLSLYMDYTKTDRIKENKERQAFWSPTGVKDTDEAIQLFADWYYLK